MKTNKLILLGLICLTVAMTDKPPKTVTKRKKRTERDCKRRLLLLNNTKST